MEEEIVILISNVFSPQKNNPVIQKERIKTRKSAHVFAGKQVLLTLQFICWLPAVLPQTLCLFGSKQNGIKNMR